MNNMTRRSLLVTIGTGVAGISLVWWLWSYALSFQSVTFTYDDSLGYIELTSDHTEPLYPPAGQEIRLKKADYQLQTIGDNIAPHTKKLTIDSDTSTIKVEFSYTAKYLKNLHNKEQPAITERINASYPQLAQLYTIEHGALYGRGDTYGAQLVAKQKSDHSDTLRILLQKKSDKWRVVSKPPTPLLSAPDYPNIDKEILRSINQAR